MEHVLTWKKAVIGSVSCHIVAGLALGIIGWHVSQMAVEEAYEIDLSIPLQEEQEIKKTVEFPKPLAMDEMVNRVTVATQNANPNAGGGGGGTPLATPTPVAPASVVAPGAGTMPIPGAREGNQTSFNGLGTGYNTEGGTVGDGLGSGEGSGVGSGNEAGVAPGEPFDTDGFWSAVNANKAYPPMAIRRNIEGDVTVEVTLDSSGNLVAADVVSSSNRLLAEAALSAVRSATPYNNPTGESITISVPVSFRLAD
ncbi:energy transducer TonB [Veillonella criceti]|uniref:TonB family C-terminal domain n=1 Tax=Veillonella criceti TaxID=103891 RepID=A0A380NCU6_9FIRM|nr:energy transducer TonB [Veillonella criceti]SUP37143.1 TonB family C-terminal domain [Veillonella criceti]